MPTPAMDFSNRRNGMLMVTTPTGRRNAYGYMLWNAVCDCGNHIVMQGRYITKQRSCGCRGKGQARPGNDPFVSLYSMLRSKHDLRSEAVVISFDEYKNLAQSSCFYCGAQPSNLYKSVLYQGIDRVNNSRGYEPNNCVPCCAMCNGFKSKHSMDTFLAHVKQIAKHQGY